MIAMPLAIRAVGMVSSVGDSALECHASVKAGIARAADTRVMSREASPLRMALVPASALGPSPLVDTALRSTRARRMLRLAAAAIREASDAAGGAAMPLSVVTSARDAGSQSLLDDLATILGDRVARGASAHRSDGAAGVFAALVDAAARIARGEVSAVMVVGVDSMLDLARLDALQRARRVLVDDASDAFVPGEGAAALVVCAAASGALATVAGVGVADDPFCVEGEGALTGRGLTEAVRDAMAGAVTPCREVWAGLNGESWTAKEWGLAARRNHAALSPDAALRHPVESFGDPGAALGAMLVAHAALGLHRGVSRGSCLAWAVSEEGLRGAVRLERA